MSRERAALARNMLIFFAGLAIAGLLIGVLDGPFQTINSMSVDITQTSHAADGRGYVTAFWDALPFIVVFLSFIQLLGAAAAERRLPGQ